MLAGFRLLTLSYNEQLYQCRKQDCDVVSEICVFQVKILSKMLSVRPASSSH